MSTYLACCSNVNKVIQEKRKQYINSKVNQVVVLATLLNLAYGMAMNFHGKKAFQGDLDADAFLPFSLGS